jgi:septal ring factor EnvC (AmiA/AmiB activator)
MSWTQAQQDAAVATMMSHIEETNTAFEAWYNGLQGGQPAQTQAALEDVLRRWRASIQQLRATSDTLMASEGELDAMQQMIKEVEDQKSLLAKLQSENGTRVDQAVSVNPKITASPYTNLLFLQRTFRPSTRMGILIATIVFAVLALAVVGFIVYRFVVLGGDAAPASYPSAQGGGGYFGRKR